MKHKSSLVLIIILLSPVFLFSQVDYKERAEKNIPYLIRDSILFSQVSIDDDAIRIYTSLSDRKNDKPEAIIYWDDVPYFIEKFEKNELEQALKVYKEKGDAALPYSAASLREKSKPTSLRGMRIALDPGHFAGNFKDAVLERKFIRMRGKDLGVKKDIEFYEADFTWKTAKILAKRLEAQGATVMITRKKGKGVEGLSYRKWLKKKFISSLKNDVATGTYRQDQMDWYLNKATEKDKYRYANKQDLIKRAEVINAFQPDLTIHIHYNASGKVIGKDGYYEPVSTNYAMAFTGGGFMKGELSSPMARLHFLRLLITTDLERSISFSDEVMKEHPKTVKVPLIKNKNNVRYLNKNSVYADAPGVYCRNLALTRMVMGPICFTESFLQDNANEAVLLSQKNYKEAGVKTSSRIKLVVDALETGIKEYVKN